MYHHLMNSKDELLTSLSPAERRSLTTSYDLLEDAWGRNSTEALKETLDQRYRELRSIQSELNSNFNEFRQNIEQELKASLRMRSGRLKKQRGDFEVKKRSSNELFKTGKARIEQDEETLKLLREKYAGISLKKQEAKRLRDETLAKRRAALSMLWKKLELTLSRLGETKELNKQALMPREELLAKWRQDLQTKRQAFLDGLKSKSAPGLPTMQDLSARKKEASSRLSRAQETNKRALEDERKSLEESLHDFEKKSLEQLWNEQLEQAPDLPDELRRFLREEQISHRLQKLRGIESEHTELLRILDRELTKRGIDRAKFLAQYAATHAG